MSQTAIEIRGLSKKYRVGRQRSYLALRDVIAGAFKNPLDLFKRAKSDQKEDFWALRDIFFEIKQGEVVGVIGRNGAGKTTLLKVLSRITHPTCGQVMIRGRVGSLLEVGTGFHPELTGRENIYFNGSILGMKKREIDKRFDEIVDFSGVKRFLDTPVKRYSSGMQVRLAFSVAAHLDPEILLIDEVLAVGDAQFQKKCLGKMKNVSEGGRTVLFVSHNMTAVLGLCKRVIMLEGGSLSIDGESQAVVSSYLNQNLSLDACISYKDFEKKIEGVVRRGAPTILLKEICLSGSAGQPTSSFRSSEEVTVAVSYECLQDIFDLRLIVQIVDEDNRTIILSQNNDDPDEAGIYERKAGRYTSFCKIPSNLLGQKRFFVSVQLINLKVEHLILNKILAFDVLFEGYNLEHGDFGDAFLRPRLLWKTVDY